MFLDVDLIRYCLLWIILFYEKKTAAMKTAVYKKTNNMLLGKATTS